MKRTVLSIGIDLKRLKPILDEVFPYDEIEVNYATTTIVFELLEQKPDLVIWDIDHFPHDGLWKTIYEKKIRTIIVTAAKEYDGQAEIGFVGPDFGAQELVLALRFLFPIKHIGIDISTTAVTVRGRSPIGLEAFSQVEMEGAVSLFGEPAFDLHVLPGLIVKAIKNLLDQGWRLAKDGFLVLSVRQHDLLVIYGKKGNLQMTAALSWMFSRDSRVGREFVEMLRQMGAENTVGYLEERFGLVKLCWLLGKLVDAGDLDEDLKQVHRVFLTGDWIVHELTGVARTSMSDAICNGLVNQQTRELAGLVFQKLGFNLEWFAPLIESDQVVGTVRKLPAGSLWCEVSQIFQGWKMGASLGDNHAGNNTLLERKSLDGKPLRIIAISAGTSGTVTCLDDSKESMPFGVGAFSFYQKRMWLTMVHHCGDRYQKFVEQYGHRKSYPELDKLALEAYQAGKGRMVYIPITSDGCNVFPAEWSVLDTIGLRIASMQFSIAFDLCSLVVQMIELLLERNQTIDTIVITGGLSRSRAFQLMIRDLLEEGAKAHGLTLKFLVAARQSKEDFQPACRGAMFGAMLLDSQSGYQSLGEIITDLCPMIEL